MLATGGALLMLDLTVVVAGDLAWRLPDSLIATAFGQLSRALARDATGVPLQVDHRVTQQRPQAAPILVVR